MAVRHGHGHPPATQAQYPPRDQYEQAQTQERFLRHEQPRAQGSAGIPLRTYQLQPRLDDPRDHDEQPYRSGGGGGGVSFGGYRMDDDLCCVVGPETLFYTRCPLP
jgi:hypothetical protein